MQRQIDAFSETWAVVQAAAVEALETARNRLEARGQPEREADFERGRASLAREILALSTPAPMIAAPPSGADY